MAELQPSQIRERILKGRYYCVKELAEIAIDQKFLGFEDPRSAAGFVLGRKAVACQNVDCTVQVKVTAFQEKADIAGDCVIDNACLSELWEDKENSQLVDDVGIKTASSELLSFSCPHIACSFHCGFTIDGNSGSGGECMRTTPTATPEALQHPSGPELA